MAKIGCLKPFRGSWNGMKDIVLEDGEIAFITEGSKMIYFGNGTDKVENLTPFADISTFGIKRWHTLKEYNVNTYSALVTAIENKYNVGLNGDAAVLQDTIISNNYSVNPGYNSEPVYSGHFASYYAWTYNNSTTPQIYWLLSLQGLSLNGLPYISHFYTANHVYNGIYII